jgi:hypothetical protein
MEALSGNLDVTLFTNVVDIAFVSIKSIQAYDVMMDHSSSFSFSNFELSNFSFTATPFG